MGWSSRLNSTGLFKLNHFMDVGKIYLYIVVTNNLPGILDHGSIDEINTLPRILDRGSKSLTSTLVRIGSCHLADCNKTLLTMLQCCLLWLPWNESHLINLAGSPRMVACNLNWVSAPWLVKAPVGSVIAMLLS